MRAFIERTAQNAGRATHERRKQGGSCFPDFKSSLHYSSIFMTG